MKLGLANRELRLAECLALALACVLAGGIVQAAAGGQAEALYKRAQALEASGQYDKALLAARAVVQDYSGTKQACLAECIAGSCVARQGQIVEGAKDLMRVESMLPDRSDIAPLAEAGKRLEKVCEAAVEKDVDLEASLEPVLKSGKAPWLSSMFPQQLNRAKFVVAKDLLWHSGKAADAARARPLFKELMKDPSFDKAALSYNIAYTYYVERNWVSAMHAFETAQGLGKGTSYEPAAEFMAGDCYERMGNSAGASAAYKDIITRFPDCSVAQEADVRLGRLLNAKDQAGAAHATAANGKKG